ncbi:flagellar basal body rod protein FlgC [Gammaproteobacteria bacterium 45_16_T64]|nr:flagellar basal body rod protein FlgC [Gammaproteobacteria bacterium 45_16_T64]
MSLMDVFNIASSGMSAQTVRLNTTSSNIANAESVSSNMDETYRARQPVFATQLQNELQQDPFAFNGGLGAGAGVKVAGIVESDAPYQLRYEPHHPMSNEEGYVAYPNVNVVEEMTNMISASRSFQTNADMMKSAKDMMQRALQLGQ